MHTMEVHGRHVFHSLNFYLDFELRAGKPRCWCIYPLQREVACASPDTEGRPSSDVSLSELLFDRVNRIRLQPREALYLEDAAEHDGSIAEAVRIVIRLGAFTLVQAVAETRSAVGRT